MKELCGLSRPVYRVMAAAWSALAAGSCPHVVQSYAATRHCLLYLLNDPDDVQ